MKMQSRFFKQSCLPWKEKTYLSSGNYKTCFIIPCCHACLSESFHVFELRIACRCNRFPSRRRRRAALSIWHQLTQSIQRGESYFQEKCIDFHEIHPRVAYYLTHVCISWSVHTNKWRTTHNAVCGYCKFSFRIFIYVYLNFSEYKQ